MRKVLEIEPDFWIAHLMLGKHLERLGRYEEALEAFARAEALSGGTTEPLSLAGYTQAVSGHRADAERALAELTSRSARAYVPPYNVAMVHLGLGNSDEAFRWLERAYEERDVHTCFLAVDPKWDAVRADPRYVRLLNRLNLRN
jgi:Flp pilus assembly protein TadD